MMLRGMWAWSMARRLGLSLVVVGATAIGASGGVARPRAGALDSAAVEAEYGQLPLSFESNQGQADGSVDYLVRGASYSIALSGGDALVELRGHPTADSSATAADDSSGGAGAGTVRMRLVDGAAGVSSAGLEPLAGMVNYMVGNDPTGWLTDIPTFGRVAYAGVYPGVDVVYYGSQEQLEDDFILQPGADAGLIHLAFDGADEVQLDDAGGLLIRAGDAQLSMPSPRVYQDGPQGRQVVDGQYVLDGTGEVGFTVGTYDATRPLVIDPVLVYSTYVGGTTNDLAFGIAVDAAGSAYITGQSGSASFGIPPNTIRRGGVGDFDVFVAKLNPSGTGLVYTTFFGGKGLDQGAKIAVDATGDAYVTGGTLAANFPTTPGSFQTSIAGSSDAFVTKLNPSGDALIYSTFIGGAGFDGGTSIAVDTSGDAYVTGLAGRGFPTSTGAFQTTPPGENGAFVAKLDPSGRALLYSTFLAGSVGAVTSSIAIDAHGDAYVGGTTESADFPTTPGAFQRTARPATPPDLPLRGFVTKLNPTGSGLIYSTFLGGSREDSLSGIAIDSAGNAYVTGATSSADFPTTAGAFQQSFHGPTTTGGTDAFISKLNARGSELVYSTFLGGSRGADSGIAVAVDATGSAFVVGSTGAADFPSTPGAFQPTFGGPGAGQGFDAFVTRLNPSGSALAYSTFLGGSSDDTGTSIALDTAGNAFVTGITQSTNFPTTPGAPIPRLRSADDAFVAKIGPAAAPVCRLSSVSSSSIHISAQDTNSGLNRIQVTESVNASISIPVFTAGTRNAVVVTANKVDLSRTATVGLRVTNVAGQFTDCDPALVSIGGTAGESPVQVVRHLSQGESQVTIVNGSPGLERLVLLVNGHRFEADDLHDGETRAVDVSAAMRKGERNTILLVGHGPRDSSATVLVSDS